ncbi:hypothetical protein [Actinomadura sp. 9N215]|uniref:hypothetical protein n=1 Tax=Actinomadura sp. 9N215 TaxID=3375150 RepID=UPI0037967FD9
MAEKRVVSAEATGGGGTLFEYRVAAVLLAHMVCEASPHGLPVSVRSIGLQQQVRGHRLDDIIISGDDSLDGLATEFQVKKYLRVTENDRPFVDVVEQALHVLADRHFEVECGDRDLGVAAGGAQRNLSELRWLADRAYCHLGTRLFFETIEKHAVKERYRTRLDHVKEAVVVAINRGAPDLGGVEETTYAFLRRLQVWCVSVVDGGDDHLRSLHMLKPIAESLSLTPQQVFNDLLAYAQTVGLHAGTINADMVNRYLKRLRGRASSVRSSRKVSDVISVDAVLRGPFKALRIDGELAIARSLFKDNDARAPEAFAKLAEALHVEGFMPHVHRMRSAQASALLAAGSLAEAVELSIGLAWDHLDRAQPWDAHAALAGSGRRRDGIDWPIELHRASRAADEAIWVTKGAGLSGFLESFDELEPGDPHSLRAAVFLCEEAIAAARPELVVERLEALQRILEEPQASNGDETKRSVLRAQMCLADATGTWDELMRTVRLLHPPQTLAWLDARHGRYLALHGNGLGSEQAYLSAIERAVPASMFDEAADWLYALRTVRFWYHDGEDVEDEHSVAQTLRPLARTSRLPGSPYLQQHAYSSALDDDKTETAIQRTLRWRWQAVLRAQLTDEIDAQEKLGRLLQRRGDLAEARDSLVRAGASKYISSLAKRLPEERVLLPPLRRNAPPVQHAAAFAFTIKTADLLSDDDARTWADWALEEVAKDESHRWAIEPSPCVQAFQLLKAVAGVLDQGQVERFLVVAQTLLDHPKPYFRRVDRTTVRILVALAHAGYSEALPLLVGPLVSDELMGDVVYAEIPKAKRHITELVGLLGPLAATNPRVCGALIRVGADPEPLRPYAEATLERQWTSNGDDSPATAQWYAPGDAILASILDIETRQRFASILLDRALDQGFAPMERSNDLRGLFNLARHLDSETQARCRLRLLELARGLHGAGISHRFDHTSVPNEALACAAAFQPNEQQTAEIEQIVLKSLKIKGESESRAMGHVLSQLPAHLSRFDPNFLASHPFPIMRIIAAYRWRSEGVSLSLETVHELATDGAGSVRRETAASLAKRISLSPEEKNLKRLLQEDARRSVRQAATADHSIRD